MAGRRDRPELADEADGLIADENLRDTAFEKRGMAVGVQPVRLVQIKAQQLQKRMAFGETGARVGAERAQPEFGSTSGLSRHIQDRDFANLKEKVRIEAARRRRFDAQQGR